MALYVLDDADAWDVENRRGTALVAASKPGRCIQRVILLAQRHPAGASARAGAPEEVARLAERARRGAHPCAGALRAVVASRRSSPVGSGSTLVRPRRRACSHRRVSIRTQTKAVATASSRPSGARLLDQMPPAAAAAGARHDAKALAWNGGKRPDLDDWALAADQVPTGRPGFAQWTPGEAGALARVEALAEAHRGL